MSAVRKLEYEYPQFDIDPSPVLTQTVTPKRPQAVVSKQGHLARLKAVMSFSVLCLFVVLSLAYVLSRYALINELQYETFQTKQRIEALEIQADELYVQIETNMTREQIEEQAIERLGMVYPTQSQRVTLVLDDRFQLNESIAFESLPTFDDTPQDTSFTGKLGTFFSWLYR